jgi:hypothetical protein
LHYFHHDGIADGAFLANLAVLIVTGSVQMLTEKSRRPTAGKTWVRVVSGFEAATLQEVLELTLVQR